MRLRTQVLLLQIAIIAISLGAGFGVVISGADDRIREEYGQRALAIAQAVATDPAVRAGVAAHQGPTPSVTGTDLANAVQQRANAVRAATSALFVVVGNADGIRLAHPDPNEVGRHLSTDASIALAGRNDLTTDRGTLGESVRAKVPVRNDTGQVVGVVSVGVSTARLGDETRHDVLTIVLIALCAMAIGLIGSLLLARRWQRLTLGLQPDELAELLREQGAVLHSLADGVLAVDPRGVVRVANDRARDLLALTDPVGKNVADLGLTPRVRTVVHTPTTEPLAATVGERVVLISSHRVTADGRDLGMVVSVLDRTDVEELTREIDAIQEMSTALRAQRHETANRMHVLAGLLRHGDVDAAAQYLDEISGTGPRGGLDGVENIEEPHLHAFLEAKAAYARERGVSLRIGEQTWVSGHIVDPVVVTSVVGNLVDNAIDAAADAGNDPSVEVEILTAPADAHTFDASGDGIARTETLWVTVADSGPGIAADDPERIFLDGVTTKSGAAPGGRGMGLAIVRQLARRTGGDVTLVDRGGAGRSGAVFVAHLPGVIEVQFEQAAYVRGGAEVADAD